jgi:hypothetical protein
MIDNLVYNEKITSNKTTGLFLGLTVVFLLFFIWRTYSVTLDTLGIIFLCFFVIFFFYTVNYRTLQVHITLESVKLIYGMFSWKVPTENIEDCRLDDVPALMRMGGAGIHFMFIRNRYRASFNFLEYPRIVIGLKRKKGTRAGYLLLNTETG